jgi:hypothetical protein
MWPALESAGTRAVGIGWSAPEQIFLHIFAVAETADVLDQDWIALRGSIPAVRPLF